MKIDEVIKRPLVTEKGSIAQQASNQYFFEVGRAATKHDIRSAVEQVFKVKVSSVHTMNMPGKFKRVGRTQGRTSEWKKAIVTLKEGDRIEVLESA